QAQAQDAEDGQRVAERHGRSPRFEGDHGLAGDPGQVGDGGLGQPELEAAPAHGRGPRGGVMRNILRITPRNASGVALVGHVRTISYTSTLWGGRVSSEAPCEP